jgi:hypothetical protein
MVRTKSALPIVKVKIHNRVPTGRNLWNDLYN